MSRIQIYVLVFGFLIIEFLVLLLADLSGDIPDPFKLTTYVPSLSTKIYDRNSELITELFHEKRELITFRELPAYVINAFISIEDRNFFKHAGIYPKSLLRAFIKNMLAGRAVEGGSTITQQLAKMIFLKPEKTLERKLKEIILTIYIERNFSKDEILEMYLNQLYFGSGVYGLKYASLVYFGKDPAYLQVHEAALLAAIPKNPSKYSPFKNTKLALERRNLVLKKMYEYGYVDLNTYIDAIKKPLPLKAAVAQYAGTGSYFIEYIRTRLESEYGDLIYKGGLNIYTTMDLNFQRTLEYITNKKMSEYSGLFPHHPLGLKPQVAAVVLEQQTGGVLALTGGVSFQESQFNRAIQAKRQPGSAFKPFLYLAAFEAGLNPATTVDDYPLGFFKTKGWKWHTVEFSTVPEVLEEYLKNFKKEDVWFPKNWDDKYLGRIILRNSLAFSRNLGSVRTIYKISPEWVSEVASRCGIKSPIQPVLSLALGTIEVSPVELTGAYNTIFNSGRYVEPYFIEKIVDRNGKIIYEHIPNSLDVISEDLAYLILDQLKAVCEYGTARASWIVSRERAGKTGTTQDFRDVWFIGAIKGITAGFWIGFDDNFSLGKNMTAAVLAVPMWSEYMVLVSTYVPKATWEVPSNIVFETVCGESGGIATELCPKKYTSAFLKNNAPNFTCPLTHIEKPVEVEVIE